MQPSISSKPLECRRQCLDCQLACLVTACAGTGSIGSGEVMVFSQLAGLPEVLTQAARIGGQC
jgi:hypothetical protein